MAGELKDMRGFEAATGQTSDEVVTRRDFFTLVGWGGFLAAMAGVGVGSFKFYVPTVLYEPPTTFKIGPPKDYGVGVDVRWKAIGQFWVVKEDGGMYALVSICRHLGCTPNWFPDQERFRCPCHGSIYDINGNVRGGPAPRTLWRAAISLDPVDGQIIVNTSVRQDPDPKSIEGIAVYVDPSTRKNPPYYINV
jgi:cytochrome b6-f complex iron-sulfur subunit